MAELDPLIRVRRHAVEQKQKFLSELYRQAEELEGQKNTLLEQQAEEQRKVQEMGVEMLSYFGPYNEAVKERVAEIEESMAKLNVRIEAAREDMRAAFAELKKVEITNDARKAEAQAELDKKESDELDAIGVEGYRRRQTEET